MLHLILLGTVAVASSPAAPAPVKEQVVVYLNDPKILDLTFVTSKSLAPSVSAPKVVSASLIRDAKQPTQIQLLPLKVGTAEVIIADETGAPKLDLVVQVSPSKRFHAFQAIPLGFVTNADFTVGVTLSEVLFRSVHEANEKETPR